MVFCLLRFSPDHQRTFGPREDFVQVWTLNLIPLEGKLAVKHVNPVPEI